MSATAESASDGSLPSLSLRSFCVCLAITLAIFVGLNPIWEPLDMDAMDANIGWSYAPIPLLVLGALALERKLRWPTLAVEMLKLTLVKFAITFLAANVVWAVSGPPQRTATEKPGRPPSEPMASTIPRDPPPPSVIDAAATGGLAGRVTAADGRPAAGVLVHVAQGLEGLVFAPPAEAVLLSDSGGGFGPALSIVQAFQPVTLRSTDGMLHTAHAADAEGRQLFNYPVLPSTDRALIFDRGAGLVTITCKVHGHDQRTARLAVVSHPFAAFTDDEGRFRFTGVPAGELELVAWTPEAGSVRHALHVSAGGENTADLALP
ncbi:MAG: carboxypeptidase-like regulatory domain-containing protein [Planctomycetota bacterium]